MRPRATLARAARLALVLGPSLALSTGPGCAAPQGADAPVGARASGEDDLAVVTPARWIYHPREAPTPTSAMPIGDGRCIVATDEGERWLVPANGDRCEGEALGAAFGAPEPLRRIARAGGTWQFVGASGTLFEAADPVGPFERVLAPPVPLARVASRGSLTLGLASDGTPYRLARDGWAAADAGGARLFDVDVDEAGRALALAWPERVLTSTDGGATFRPAAPPPATVGALAVRWTRGASVAPGAGAKGAPSAPGTLGIAGVRGGLTWTDDGRFVASRRDDARNDAGEATVRTIALGPRATAVPQGRATATGSRWYEARPAEDVEGKGDGAGWVLVRGRLGGTFEAVPLAGTQAEREVRLAASGRVVAIATSVAGGEDRDGDDRDDDDDDRTTNLVVSVSRDEGSKFVEVARLRAPDVRQVRLAASPSGDVLVTGACPPAREPMPEAGPARDSARERARDGDRDECRPRAPVLVHLANGAAPATVVVGVAGELRGRPSAPVFSADGSSAYFVATRAKGEEPALFVSDDGARTWSAHPLRRRGTEDEEPRRSWEDGEESARSGGDVELAEDATLTVDADGAIGIPVTTNGSSAWMVAEADGEVRGFAAGPSESVSLAGFGRRALAVELSSNELTTWETNDGGANWTRAGTFRVRLEGDLQVACSASGCVVGDGVTRLGWEVADITPERAMARSGARPPNLLTPLTCDLDPRGWGAIARVEPTAPFPTLDDIARGRAAWSVLSIDRASSAVSVHHTAMEGPDASRIVTRALLEPAPKGKAGALRPSHQGEGYAVARHVEGATEIEVGWVNFIDGTSGSRAVPLPPGAKPRRTMDAGSASFDTGLLSVTSGGIFVQPMPGVGEVAFLDPRGGRTASPLPSWSQLGVAGRVRDDAARVGGKTIFVGVVDAGPVVGLLGVRQPDGSVAVEATTLAPPPSSGTASVTSWTYSGQVPGFLAMVADASGDGWSAGVWRAFEEGGRLGAPVAVPTLHDLPDRPRPCRAEEVRTTPRTEAPLVIPMRGVTTTRGRRHPVVIVGGAEDRADATLHLLTAGAVLHGTPSSPCLAGWEATGIDGRRATAVILGDPSRAWVFRLAAPGAGGPSPGVPAGTPNVEVRGMSCRWDPTAPVPDGAWDEIGVK